MFTVMFLFLVYMLHFGHHSITKKNFVELVSFLIMSLISTTFTIYNIVDLIVFNMEGEAFFEGFISFIGYLSVLLLIIGNVVFIVSAYHAFSAFDEDFIETIGAKMSFQRLFNCINVNNCMVKNDFGVLFFLLITDYMIKQESLELIILDTILTFSVAILVKLMKKVLKDENKCMTIVFCVYRLLVEVYKLWRCVTLSCNTNQDDLFIGINFIIAAIIVIYILDTMFFVLFLYSALKSIQYFGKGMKEQFIRKRSNQSHSSNSRL